MFDAVFLFRDALYGSLILALGCSVLGVWVVLRRIVFVGAALAELSSAGIALAFWLEGIGVGLGLATHPLAVSLVVTVAAALAFAGGVGRQLVPPDAKIGFAYAVAGAVGILLIAKAAHGEAHDLMLEGNILGISHRDMLVLLAVTVPVLLAHAAFYKEFLFTSFDRETARTLGYHVGVWNVLLYATLGIVIAFAMQFAGVLLVFNFLVLPAVTGLLLARTMAGTFALAIVSALLAALVGFTLSIPFDLPTGPTIVAVSGVITLIAWIVRLLLRR